MEKTVTYNASTVTSLNKLWGAMRTVLRADEFAYMLSSLRVSSFRQLSSDWVKTLQVRMEQLNEAGKRWSSLRTDIASALGAPVMAYQNHLSTLHDYLREGCEEGQHEAAELLKELLSLAEENVRLIRKRQDDMDTWVSQLKSCMCLLDESLAEGWSSLDMSEQSVARLDAKIALLEKQIADTQGEVLPEYIGQEYDFAKSYGEMVYSVIVGGESLSYLSIAGLFFSIGTTFYDALSAHLDIVSYCAELEKCKNECKMEQAALVQTKSLLRFLQKVQLNIAGFASDFQMAADLWEHEKDFLKSQLMLVNAGTAVRETAFVQENAVWETLADCSKRFLFGNYKKCEFKLQL